MSGSWLTRGLKQVPGALLLRRLRHRLHERRLIAKLVRFYSQRHLRPGDLVIDVGANVGTWTEAFLRIGARVVASASPGGIAIACR
jgi:hypothetical protein